MFFSKIWYIVVAVAAALAFGGALVVPKPAMREISKAAALGLDRTQHNAELLLRLGARDWIDAVAGLSADRKLVEVLELANDRRGDVAQLKARGTERLLTLTGKLPADRRPELMIAVDTKGKQIARVGPGDAKLKAGKDGLIGYPLVQAALRGFRRDDTWNVDGKLYLMFASPVISRARGRYVGAVLLGREINNGYVLRLKARLGGADLVFFLRRSVVATTITSSALTALWRSYEDKREQIAKDGRSAAMNTGEGEDAHNVILAPLPGEASHHDAFYAVVGPPTPMLGPIQTIKMVRGNDVAWGKFPWLMLGGGLLVVLVVGLGLMAMEGDVPARRFLRGVTALGRGELSRLEDRGFAGRFGSMARAVNNAMDRAEKRAAPATKDIGRILGSPAEKGTRPDLRLDPNFSSMPPLASGVETLGALGASKESPAIGEKELRKAGPPLSATTLDPEEAETELQTELPAFADRPVPAPPEVDFGAAGSFGLEPSVGPVEPEDAPSHRKVRIPESELSASPTSPKPPPPPKPLEELPPLEDSGMEELPPLEAPEPIEEPAAGGAADEPEAPRSEEAALKEYFEDVYNQFVAVKRQCGESTDSLTLERFEGKLRQNRENLIERYKCKSVKFQVYIKDGKAAIKATPVKE